MQHVRPTTFLSLFIFTNLLSQKDIIKKPNPNKGITIKQFEDEQKIENHKSTDNKDKSTTQQSTFNEIDIEEMKLVFESSPKEAQYIIKHLQDPTFFELIQDYRSIIFVGEPGTGKTTMAKAIAYTMSEHGWDYKILSSTSLLGEHRNQTALRLQKKLAAIEASKKPTILIIDELNRLLENTESKHHDTDTTATTLWTFLDKQKGNKNFFFIGTMNRVDKLPKPYKSRIILNYIKFSAITDPQAKNDFIRKKLTTKNTILDAGITDIFLNEELKKIGPCVGRDLNNISDAIYKTSKMTQNTPSCPMVITKAAIIHVMDLYLKNKIELDYDTKEETDEERQNRYHKENQEMQERHFVQQQMIQVAIQDHQYVDASSNQQNHHFISAEGKKKINSLISDEQKQLYENMMQNTRERESREAAIKAAIDKAAAEKAKAEAELWFWQRT